MENLEMGMMKNNPTFEKEDSSKPKRMKVANCSALSLREAPNSQAKLIGPRIIREGDKVIIIETHNDEWSKVQTAEGIEAYVMTAYLTEC